MNYHGTESIYIYTTGEHANTLTGGSLKRMWTYTTDETDDEHDNPGGRPRLLAKFGDRFLPVSQRAGRRYIVVGDAAAPQPQPARPATVEAAVAEMVALGKANKPELAERLLAAASLVRAGNVTLTDEAAAAVGPYQVTAGGCTCADFKYRGGWCKHRLSVRMARHLVANGYDLPVFRITPRMPQISAANQALINSGKVIDDAGRERRAYARSDHGARTAALRALGNGARSLPADLARRVGIGPDMSCEIRDANEEAVCDGR